MRPSRHLFCFSSPVLGDIRNELETSTISLWSEVRDLLVVFLPVDANGTAPPGQCGQMQWDASSVAYVLSRIGRNLFANMADRRLPPSVDRLCPVGRTRGNSDRFECLPASQKHLIIEMTSASHSWALVERPTSPHATYLFSQVEHARLRQISAQAAEMMRHRLGSRQRGRQRAPPFAATPSDGALNWLSGTNAKSTVSKQWHALQRASYVITYSSPLLG